MKKKRYASRRSWLPLVLGLILFAAIAMWVLRGVQQAARVSDQEGLRMARQAIDRAVISCYSLEGVYPATYDELKAKSGLAVDDDKYVVFYDIFASNIRPSVTVMERWAGP